MANGYSLIAASFLWIACAQVVLCSAQKRNPQSFFISRRSFGILNRSHARARGRISRQQGAKGMAEENDRDDVTQGGAEGGAIGVGGGDETGAGTSGVNTTGGQEGHGGPAIGRATGVTAGTSESEGGGTGGDATSGGAGGAGRRRGAGAG